MTLPQTDFGHIPESSYKDEWCQRAAFCEREMMIWLELYLKMHISHYVQELSCPHAQSHTAHGESH